MSHAKVMLWGTEIGSVALPDGASSALFRYSDAIQDMGIELSPIVMPLSSQVYSFPELSRETFRGLPGLVADSLPDKFGNAVIENWLKSQKRESTSFSSIDFLCYIGTRGMGALEFEPAYDPHFNQSDMLEVEKLVELASSILSKRKQAFAHKDDLHMQQLIQVGTSAGGARAKALIAWNESTGEIRSGQLNLEGDYSQWILKFDGVSGNGDKEGEDRKQYTVIEYAYHLMALSAGIEMAECRLLEEGTRRHFMTRRFDRTADGKKLHMQTLGALAHFDFYHAGAYGYEQAVEVTRKLGLGQVEAESIFRRMIFNVAACNRDDHVKNISFLMDRQGQWRLSPAYDLTFAYNPLGLWTNSHQMTINGKREHVTYVDCLDSARRMSIKQKRAETIMGEVMDAVNEWRTFAQKATLDDEVAAFIQSNYVALSMRNI